MIATADSALGQVSSLLNDIRGLVVEAANTGALSADQIAANQLQVDSSLEAINRIAQTTTFQGRRLLDGSLDFMTTINTVRRCADSQIDQANLGYRRSMAVEVAIQHSGHASPKSRIPTVSTAAARRMPTLDFTAGAIRDHGNAVLNVKATAAGRPRTLS